MKGRRYRVFISHSANRTEEPSTQDFLDELLKRVREGADIEALVDQRSLRAGDEWCQRLYAWLGLCDAAVILLSPRAIKRESSTWVPREVNLLMWRKALDPSFLIIPVLVSGLRFNEIAENPFVASSRLKDIEFAEGLSDGQKIDRIVQELTASAEASVRAAVFDPVRVFVEDSICRFAPNASVEATLMKHYGDDPWRPYTRLQGLLAMQMVRHAVAPDVDTVITDVALGSQPEYHLGTRLFRALFPMRLPAESSCALLTLCRAQEVQGAVVVNCHDSWAVRMMLRAATGQLEDELLRSWRIIELPDGWGDDDKEEITDYLANELAEAILGTGGWELLSEEADPLRALAAYLTEFSRASGVPILVCTRFSPRWVELAPLLAARFPTTVFLLWSGETMPSLPDADGRDAVLLDPALPNGSDRRWNLGYRMKMQLLGN